MIRSMTKIHHIVSAAMVAATVLAATSAQAMAQLPATPGRLSAEGAWLKWVVGGVLLVCVGVAGFKSAKRTHLD